MMRKRILAMWLLGCAVLSGYAQTTGTEEQRLVAPSRAFFVPHWYIKAQGGAAYDLGEAKFSQLLSPAVQLAVGYRFTEDWGLRLAVNGFFARNRYAYPVEKYSWNFIQPTLEAQVNLTSLFLGHDPERLTSVYAFLGGGFAYTFNNDDAVEANKHYGVNYQKLWKDNRWNLAARGGLGVDFRISDILSLNAEMSATMLPDHFNSKRGRHDNRDWHFNALVGIKFAFGKTCGRTEPVYERTIVPTAQPAEEKIRFSVNIQFVINQSIIRPNQLSKLSRLADYLRKHPNAYVRLTGYADKETGNAEINRRLSRERSMAVSKWLQDEGIAESRIRKFAKGDTVQPFDLPEDNRVTICYVYNPDEEDGTVGY